MYYLKVYVVIIITFFIGVTVNAQNSKTGEFTVNQLFNNGAVLQRHQMIPVWGTAKPGDNIRCRVAGTEGWARTGSDGKYIIYLNKMEAGGPYKLQLENLDSKKTITINDVYIGEVWLASGQSNMERTLQGIKKAGTLKPDADRIHVMEPEKSFQWKRMTPEVADDFSAVAGYFAVKLQKKLNVPVGIILNAQGGSCIEAWMSRESLLSCPDYHDAVIKDELTRSTKAYVDMLAKHLTDRQRCIMATSNNIGITKNWNKPSTDTSTWKSMTLPAKWNKQGYDFNGTLWFRKVVNVPAEYAGKDLELNLGRIDKSDISYFNGVEVGQTGGVLIHNTYMVLRNYKIPGKLVHAGENVIAVRANSFVYDGGFTGPADKMFLTGHGLKIPLDGEWKCKVEQNIGKIPACIDMPKQYNDFYCLYDRYVNPLIPYGIRGVIWYQGESNTYIGPMIAPNSPSAKKMIGRNPAKYARLMTKMIADWHYRWGSEFPFLQCQLAGFGKKQVYQPRSQWAILREGQLKSSVGTGNILTQAYDLGEERDIHPKKKEELVDRLMITALYQVYGHNNLLLDPELSSLTTKGSEIIVSLKNAKGLHPKGNQIVGFSLSADGKKFYPAKAALKDGEIMVSSDKISNPVAIAYAWADCPIANLYNEAGLPLVPFQKEIKK